MSKLKIILLDFDGVMNNPSPESGSGGFVAPGLEQYYHEQIKFDPACVDTLRLLVRDSGPNTAIVIASYWRLDFSVEDVKKFFVIYGWHDAPVIASTPDLAGDQIPGPYSRFISAANRSMEALMWLDANKHRVESFVILDDMLPAEYYLTSSSDLAASPHRARIGDRFIMIDPSLGLQDSDAAAALVQLNTPWEGE